MTESAPTSHGPVFIVGMNGSGTTMLLDHLNNHPLVYGFSRESRVLPYFLLNFAKYGDLAKDSNIKRLWLDMCSSYQFRVENNGSPVPLPEDWKVRERHPATIFSYIMEHFATRAGKSLWCEKSPMHALHINLLSRSFPSARFIHVIRDGRDCAASFHRRWGYYPQSTIYRWKKTVRGARAAGALMPARYKEVFFEKLTAEPEHLLKEICAFLGLDFDDHVLVSSRDASRVSALKSKVMVHNSGKYRRHFSPKQTAEMESIAGSLLFELGYSTKTRSGDLDPGKWHLRWLETKARSRLAARLLRQGVTGRMKNPGRTILGRCLVAWRQRKTTQL